MGDRAGLRWAPLPLGVGAFMIWNVAAAGTTMVGRSLVEIRELFSVPLVALLAAAGLLAVLGAARPRWWVAAGLVILAATMVVTTILAFGDRGVVGAVGVGFALATGPLVAAWGVLGSRRPVPPHSPDVRLFEGARWGCAVTGAGLVFLFGTSIVHSWLRGVAPYDLQGLTPSTLALRFSETAPILLSALGLVALVAAGTSARRLPLITASVLTVLIAAALLQLEPATPLMLAVRVIIFIGGSVAVTALIAVVGHGRSRAGHVDEVRWPSGGPDGAGNRSNGLVTDH